MAWGSAAQVDMHRAITQGQGSRENVNSQQHLEVLVPASKCAQEVLRSTEQVHRARGSNTPEWPKTHSAEATWFCSHSVFLPTPLVNSLFSSSTNRPFLNTDIKEAEGPR